MARDNWRRCVQEEADGRSHGAGVGEAQGVDVGETTHPDQEGLEREREKERTKDQVNLVID
jgi:hypothetical protein